MTRRDLLMAAMLQTLCSMPDEDLYEWFSAVFPEQRDRRAELDMCRWCPRDENGFCAPECPPPSEFLQETIEIKENHT